MGYTCPVGHERVKCVYYLKTRSNFARSLLCVSVILIQNANFLKRSNIYKIKYERRENDPWFIYQRLFDYINYIPSNVRMSAKEFERLIVR